MSQSRNTINQLRTEIDSDFRTWTTEFVYQLRATTPIRTGYARSSWINTYPAGRITRGQIFPVATNQAPYIGVLDEGWSMQAPQGIVAQALNKTRK